MQVMKVRKAEVQWLCTPFITSITSITFITTE